MNEIIPGQTIFHYRITEKLGEGGMGVVYKAHDATLDRNVALKFLPHYLTTEPNEKARFYHEARAAAALMHQNVAVIHEINDYEGQVFISMEYVEGETIKKVIENKSESLTVTKVLEIAIQVCEGLASAHKKNIVHRDIKSDNIMLNPDGLAKIMDFGLAKLKGATRLTKEGSTVGTAAYMSPEQAKGEDVDNRSDIFSFGVVLYEMLTAHLPFPGEHQAALLYSLLNESPQPVVRFNDKVSQDFERIVFKALEKVKEERYQHIDDMLADLRKERKNLEYARSGYVKASAIHRKNEEKSKSVKIKNLKIIIPSAVLVLLVMAIFILNPFNLLVEQKPATENLGNSLAVMYFQNIPDPADKDHTGEMLTNLLITSLSQVNGLEVISRERLLDIQEDLGQTDTKVLSPLLASQVAKRAGVKSMLIGYIIQKKPKLAVTTSLINVQSGKIISSFQVRNFPDAQIFGLVDSLSYLLRNSFQISSAELTGIKSVSNVTTNSTQAYRAYIEGIELYNKLYYAEAIAAFHKATQLDSNFAMAYFYLSLLQGLNGENQESLESISKAVKLISNTSERERLQILARNYELKNNPSKEEEVLKQLIERYPHEIQAYLTLGLYFYTYQMLELNKGIEVIIRGLKINSSAKHLWNQLAYSYAYLDKRREAINAINKYIELAPAEPNPYDTKGDIYGYFMEYDSSYAAYQKSCELRKDWSAERIGEYALLRGQYNDAKQYFELNGNDFPFIEIHKGKLNAALRILEKLLNTETSQSQRLKIMYKIMHLYYATGQYSQMLVIAKEFPTNLENYLSNNIYESIYYIWALVKNNETAKAHRLIIRLQNDVANGAHRLQIMKDYISAIASFEERDDLQALEKFEEIFKKLPVNHWPNILFAITLLRNGQIPDAIVELQRILYQQPSGEQLLGSIPGEIDYWPISAVKAHYWLAVAYEKQGQKDKAIKEYEKFLDIWKDVDFNSSEIKDAKLRVSKLKEVALK